MSHASKFYFGSPRLNLDFFLPENTRLPDHWIGVEKDWEWSREGPWQKLVSVTPEQMSTHTLLIGATGSGKTNLLHHLLSLDIRRGHSIVLLDLRGDLVSAALELCAAAEIDPSLVKIIDLREKENPFGFNPLFGAGEPYYRALGVLDVVASESDSWGVQLSETLRNALLLLAESGSPITKLEDLMYDRAFRLSLLEVAESEPVINFWHRFDAMSPERQTTLVMPVLNKVSMLLSTKTLRQILGHPSPIDLGEHLNRPGSITLVSLAVDELHATAKMIGRMLLSAVCREIFSRVEIPENQRNPVRLYVDEFEHFGAPDFETILAEGRRFKLSLVLAHQSLAQLSTKLRAIILGNVGVKFVFRCGRDDGSTLSKDICGDASALAFADLPTGEAVLWRRRFGHIHLEINEPIIEEDSPYQEQKLDFVRDVYSRAGRSGPVRSARLSQPKGKTRLDCPTVGKVEDWLCE